MLFKVLLALAGIMATAYSSENTTPGSETPAVTDSADKTKSLGDTTCSTKIDDCTTPSPSSGAATYSGIDPWDSLEPKTTATFTCSNATSTSTFWGIPWSTEDPHLEISYSTYTYLSSRTIIDSAFHNPTFTWTYTMSTPVIVTENPDPTMSALRDITVTVTVTVTSAPGCPSTPSTVTGDPDPTMSAVSGPAPTATSDSSSAADYFTSTVTASDATTGSPAMTAASGPEAGVAWPPRDEAHVPVFTSGRVRTRPTEAPTTMRRARKADEPGRAG